MPGNPLSITLPTVGATVGPEFALLINAAIQALIDDIEAKIVPSEISINADLSFRTAGQSYGATNLQRVHFYEESSALATSLINSLHSVAGELTFIDGAGNVVPMTSSGAVAGAAGNITTTGSPAYATSGVEILWSGSDLEYRLKSGSGATAFANLVLAELELRNGANTTTLASAVTSDYTITFPAAGPSANNLAVFDGSGNISFTDTIPGDKTISGDLDVGGEVTASGGLADGTTVNGTLNATEVSVTDFAHGDRKLSVNAIAGVGYASDTSRVSHKVTGAPAVYVGYWEATSGSQEFYLPIPLHVGDRIKSVRFLYEGADTSTKNFSIRSAHYSVPTITTEATDNATTSTSSTKTVTPGSPISIAENTSYWAVFDAGASGDRCYGIQITYDRP